jgi:uncharacterized ferritin-like protein (DUF455 family)
MSTLSRPIPYWDDRDRGNYERKLESTAIYAPLYRQAEIGCWTGAYVERSARTRAGFLRPCDKHLTKVNKSP